MISSRTDTSGRGPTLADLADSLIADGPAPAAPESTAPPPGAVVACWTQAQGLRIGAAGVRNPAGDPMDVTTVFDLASVTKLFTTAAVMRLVHEGLVDLDVPVDGWLDLDDPVPTLRQLLRHRSGLLPWQPFYLRGDRSVAERLRGLPRIAEPDVQYSYSDLGFILIGAVIGAVTGSGLSAAMNDLVLAPLGLRASYGPREGDVATSAYDDGAERRMVETGEPYAIGLDGPFDDWRTAPITGEVNDGNTHHALAGVSGHAGMFGQVSDLILLGRALGRTDHGLWSAAVLDEFTTAGPDPQQGLGFRLRELPDGRRLSWHPGFTGCALGFTAGPASTVVAMATNRLLTRGRPTPTARLWERVLAGTGLIEEYR
ncbi:MAG: beta-lactamase family protein [Propionibacteriales bacterium]|nr:beta-lactamase family protein [Propionibacteriales bacterium]